MFIVVNVSSLVLDLVYRFPLLLSLPTHIRKKCRKRKTIYTRSSNAIRATAAVSRTQAEASDGVFADDVIKNKPKTGCKCPLSQQ